MIYSFVSWLVFGLIVGVIARFLVPGKQPMHWFATILLGIVGSFVGGGISWLVFGTSNNTVHPGGLIMSIIGAVILVLLYGRVVSAKKVV